MTRFVGVWCPPLALFAPVTAAIFDLALGEIYFFSCSRCAICHGPRLLRVMSRVLTVIKHDPSGFNSRLHDAFCLLFKRVFRR